jgi:hypothetical protein
VFAVLSFQVIYQKCIASDYDVNCKCLLGSTHVMQVTDCGTKEKRDMSLKEWVKYFNSKERDNVLSVSGMEYSFTNLESVADAPEIVSI